MIPKNNVFSVFLCLAIITQLNFVLAKQEIFTTSSKNEKSSLNKNVQKLIERILTNKLASPQDCARLRSMVQVMLDELDEGLDLSEKEESVRSLLGDEGYHSIENVLISQTSSTNKVLRISAIRILGQVMCSSSSEKVLKETVYNADKDIQVSALLSLVALETPGSTEILMSMLLSGDMSDPMAADAIKVLMEKQNRKLANRGLLIISRNNGVFAIKALLPALKERNDFSEIVRELFVSNIGRVPNDLKLTLTQHVKKGLEFDLIDEIYENYKSYNNDKDVLLKLEEYANSTAHSELYTLALLLFERSGKNIEYFSKMYDDKETPEEKRQILALIIDRIKRGERLK